ncbi:site-specific DNA methylase [Flavobacterium limnosediminis JC2902]|uniref:DNA (cytosine-5-)-methyltransferase n=2 Tax=Flavobacterium TaxID=237 RepID=V6SPK9_9FLAO|nr:site-specific DNA methylase [Flavobacterium limnosediminis JC2902]
MYLKELNPDYFYVENVREFMAWGPLCENGKPISRNAGRDYMKWITEVCNYGFKHDSKILNSADFGSYQSRERLFIQFVKHDLSIAWPEQSHTKDKIDSPLFPMEKWKPVREILDLEDEGISIFERKKELSENTLKRIYAGLLKFVAKGDYAFTKRYNGGKINPHQKVNSLDKPMGTICTNGTHAIVTASHLNTYYGNGGIHSLELPSPTVTTKDRIAKASTIFLDKQYGTGVASSIEKPIDTITAVPKFSLVKAQNFILNPAWGGNNTDVEKPCCTVVARQDKAPLYLVNTTTGDFEIPIYDDDNETMVKIKEFMGAYEIIDIKMRMLKIPELLQIQGFPKDYKLKGTQTEQKKYIGNAVEVNCAKALIRANYEAILQSKKSKVA